MDRIIEAMTATDHEEQGIFVNYSVVNDPQTQTRIATFSAGDDPVSTANTAIRIRADITFRGYTADNGVTLYGTMVLYFNATQSDSTATISSYEVESSNVDVKAGNATSAVNASGLTGTIASATATISTSETGTTVSIEAITEEITTSNTGSFTIGNETVSKAEADEIVSGGMGTEEDPFIIANEEEFLNISELEDEMLSGEYYYFQITADLDLSGYNDVGFTKFRGELDFTGHELRGVSSSQLKQNLLTLIDDIIEGKIANLDYYSDDPVALAYTCGWTSGVTSAQDEWITSFENVNVYGDFFDISNNHSQYILQAFKGALEFHNCVSYVNATGDLYDGIFLGGYPQTGQTTRLVFDGCINRGSLIVKNAGFLTGNSAGLAGEVIVNNCSNEGLVIGTESSGVYCGHSVTKPEIEALNNQVASKVSGSENVYTIDSHVTAAYNGDKTIVTIEDTSGKAASYRVSGMIYTQMKTSDYVYCGTLVVSFDMEGELNGAPAQAPFPVHQVVDYLYAEQHDGVVGKEYGNDVVTIDGTVYYLVTERHPHVNNDVTAMITGNNDSSEHVVGNLSYSVFTYDENGMPVGYIHLDV